jgi:uncharacterized protein (TIGR00255 family)
VNGLTPDHFIIIRHLPFTIYDHMKSMTGFGRGSATIEGCNVSVDLKTVNNRFLDIHLRASADLSIAEALIRRRIGERLSRGRVDAQINIERTGAALYELNRPLISGYIAAIREMQKEFSLTGEPDVNVLARLPGAMQTARDSLNAEMLGCVERALAGAALAAEMRARLDEIERHVPLIEAVAGDQVDAYMARLQRRISELLARDGLEVVELDQGRLSQEVAYLADRSDITEEITRLRSHLSQFRDGVESEGEIGKRLDFLLQELNREANTILSKSTDVAIKESALAIKAAVEKLREQVQNVE